MKKLARIRYDAGNPDAKGKIGEKEGFYLEIWDENEKSWSNVCKAECQKALNYPDERENNFISWKILSQIALLSEQGYKIEM